MDSPRSSLQPRGAGSRRVLFVSNFQGTFAGADRSLMALLNALPEDHAAVVVCPGDPAALASYLFSRAGVRFVRAPFHTYPYTMPDLQEQAAWGERHRLDMAYLLANNLAALSGLTPLLEEEPPDIVHSNTSTVVLGALVAALWNRPHVWHVHEIVAHRGPTMRWWIAMMGAYSDRIVSPSQAAAAPFGPEARVLPNVFHGDEIKALARVGQAGLTERIRLPDGDVVIVAAGVSTPVKGHHVLIAALRRLLDGEVGAARERLRLVIAGGSPDPAYRVRLESLAAELGVADRVTLLGHLPYAEVLALLEVADVVVQPSARDETLSAVPREAMVLGTPVVVTDAGGQSELVEDGVTGVLCRADDAGELAVGLSRVLDAPDFAAGLARRAAAWAGDPEQTRAELAGYLELYAELERLPRQAVPLRWQESVLRRLGRASFILAEATRMSLFQEETVAARDQELTSVKYVLAARDREVGALKRALAEREREAAALRERLGAGGGAGAKDDE